MCASMCVNDRVKPRERKIKPESGRGSEQTPFPPSCVTFSGLEFL